MAHVLPMHVSLTHPSSHSALPLIHRPVDNPLDLVAGNQHWGHATSPDLYTWTNQPIAIFPPNGTSYAFTGSIVLDPNNTSGFFPAQDNGVVAVLTIASDGPPALQAQSLAFSHDNGFTFSYYAANPVLYADSAQFRDPKVIWHVDHWVMAVSYAQDFTVGIYTSPNLRDWAHASNFSHHGLLGLQYECPNLVPIPADPALSPSDAGAAPGYAMLVSLNPGAPLGGSVSELFLGDFDGYTFTPLDGSTRLTDFAKDNYATQFFFGLPGSSAAANAISLGWASNWQYTNLAPTASECWRSAMSLPRQNVVRRIPRTGWTVAAVPYDMTPVLDEQLVNETWAGNGSLALDFANVDSNALYLRTNVTGLPVNGTTGAAATWNFTLLSPVSGEVLRGGMQFAGDATFWLDRGACRGFANVFFTDKFSAAMELYPDGTWTIEFVIDRSMMEIFIDRGDYVATSLFFTEAPLTVLSVAADGLASANTTIMTEVWALRSTWAPQENSNSTVMGNVTTPGMTMRHATYNADFFST